MIGRPSIPVRLRFWQNVEPELNTGCWLWSGHIDASGYGRIGVNGKARRAHRVSWELANGEIPAGGGHHGTCVCHRCDTPACVNPSHLFLGSNSDNVADKTRKGRALGALGERNSNAKITNQQVLEIRESDESTSEVCARYGLSRSCVEDIRAGRAWRHIKEGVRPPKGPPSGEDHPHAKATWEVVGEIRRLRGEGRKYRELSEQFGIPIGTIGHIVTNRSWQGGAEANNLRAEAA